MLQNLEIRNFQSHKASSFNFHPGMNVITGSSDSGKSAIMRSIIWALKNRPSGEAFKTWGTKESDIVDVSMEFDNGWFTKSRIKGKNKYESDNGFYEALRSDVPEEINSIAKIQDYNIQTQFQPYFMLQDSAGDRAKQLNQLVGLDIIDTIFKKLNGKVQTLKSSIKMRHQELDKVISQLDELSYIDEVSVLVDKLMSDIDTHTKTSVQVKSLSGMIEDAIVSDNKITVSSKILPAEPLYKNLKDQIDEMSENQSYKKAIQNLINQYDEIGQSLEGNTEWLEIEVPFNALQSDIKKLETKKTELEHLKSILTSADGTWRQIIGKEAELEELAESYTDLLETSGTCPVCESKINDTTIQTIKRSLL